MFFAKLLWNADVRRKKKRAVDACKISERVTQMKKTTGTPERDSVEVYMVRSWKLMTTAIVIAKHYMKWMSDSNLIDCMWPYSVYSKLNNCRAQAKTEKNLDTPDPCITQTNFASDYIYIEYIQLKSVTKERHLLNIFLRSDHQQTIRG